MSDLFAQQCKAVIERTVCVSTKRLLRGTG